MSAKSDTVPQPNAAAAATGQVNENTNVEQAHESTTHDPKEKVIFPMLLHDAVCDPSTDDCIHWLPDGHLFLISNKKIFAKKVLPRFPGNGVFTSFTRRLKRWGFERIASGPQIGAYKNEHFVRENRELVKNIKYMAQKPMSMTAIRKNIANLQAATGLLPNNIGSVSGDLSSSVGTAVNMSPDLRMGLLQSMAAHQQLSNNSSFVQRQAANPSMDALRTLLLNQGRNLAPNPNMMASMMGSGPSLPAQVAMMQSLQNQQQIQQLQAFISSQQAQLSTSTVASPSASNAKESFGAALVRTNPQLAARLLEARNALNQATQPAAARSNADIMSLFNARSA